MAGGNTTTLLQAAARSQEPGALSISAMPVSVPVPVPVPMGMAHSFLINNFVTVTAPPVQYLDK